MGIDIIEFTDVLKDQSHRILTGMPMWKPTENQTAKYAMNTQLQDHDR